VFDPDARQLRFPHFGHVPSLPEGA
jgi:hypothetical protein